MIKSIDWQDLESEVRNRGLTGLSIANGQHLINSEHMVIGYVSTPIGGHPSWNFDDHIYKASKSLIKNAVIISNTTLYEHLFQASTTDTPPFKTSRELASLLDEFKTLCKY